MPSCKFLELQKDGFHANCIHPEARPGEACILNTEDECVLREPVMTSMQISKDTLEALRAYGYPAENAVIRLLEIASKS
jgi:hypothetical protein